MSLGVGEQRWLDALVARADLEVDLVGYMLEVDHPYDLAVRFRHAETGEIHFLDGWVEVHVLPPWLRPIEEAIARHVALDQQRAYASVIQLMTV